MTSKFFQGIVAEIKDSISFTMGVVDNYGSIVACTDEQRIGDVILEGLEFFQSDKDNDVLKTNYFYKITSYNTDVEYAVFGADTGERGRIASSTLCLAINNSKFLYDEKYDKEAFVKRVIFDNILPTDIFIKARELALDSDTKRVVYLIQLEEEARMCDMVRHMYPDRQSDFVVLIDEKQTALVKEIKNGSQKEIEAIAQNLSNKITEELGIKHVIGIGSTVMVIKEIAKSFKEAQVALDVGSIFDTGKVIMSFGTLGIGRLIYQLPATLCEMFLNEIFQKGTIESLDYETRETIVKFFENNLNLSETARKLFVHRNTLVYRLEKIKRLTGLDIREFDKAATFHVAIMVQEYLDSVRNR